MQHPYLSDTACIYRLVDEYKKYGSLVIAYDFDNCVYDYHSKGHNYIEVIELLKQAKEINCYMVVFTAEKDLDELAVKISKERSKREIKPALKVLKEVSTIKSDGTEAERHFVDQTTKLYDFVLKADNVLDKITEYKDNWLAKLVVKIMK